MSAEGPVKYRRPPFSFCPWCGSGLPRRDPHRQACSSCGFVFYQNSSPCVAAFPLDASGRVLMGRRGIEPYRGAWNTIGGFLGYEEEPYAGLRREVREELGVDCEILDFVTMAEDRYGEEGPALLNAYFTVRLLSDDVRPQDDIVELRWFSLEELPDDIAFKSDRAALRILAGKLEALSGIGENRCPKKPGTHPDS